MFVSFVCACFWMCVLSGFFIHIDLLCVFIQWLVFSWMCLRVYVLCCVVVVPFFVNGYFIMCCWCLFGCVYISVFGLVVEWSMFVMCFFLILVNVAVGLFVWCCFGVWFMCFRFIKFEWLCFYYLVACCLLGVLMLCFCWFELLFVCSCCRFCYEVLFVLCVPFKLCLSFSLGVVYLYWGGLLFEATVVFVWFVCVWCLMCVPCVLFNHCWFVLCILD